MLKTGDRVQVVGPSHYRMVGTVIGPEDQYGWLEVLWDGYQAPCYTRADRLTLLEDDNASQG